MFRLSPPRREKTQRINCLFFTIAHTHTQLLPTIWPYIDLGYIFYNNFTYWSRPMKLNSNRLTPSLGIFRISIPNKNDSKNLFRKVKNIA